MSVRLTHFQQAMRRPVPAPPAYALPLHELALHPGATPRDALRARCALEWIGPRAWGTAIGGGGEGALATSRLAGMTLHGAPYKGRNEDSIGIAHLYPATPDAAPIDFLVVADGLGSHPAPHAASRTAVQSVLNAVGFHYDGGSIDDVVRSARRAFVVCRAIFAQLLAPQSATTLLVAIVQGTRGVFLHLGDSQGAAIPRATPGEWPRAAAVVTRPHQDWVLQEDSVRRRKGPTTESEWLSGPTKPDRLSFLLARSLCALNIGREAHEIEETRFTFPRRGGYVLCGSDGLTGNIGMGNTLDLLDQYPDDMAAVLYRLMGRVIRRMPATQSAIGKLLRLRASNGHKIRTRAVTGDHISALLLHVPDHTAHAALRTAARRRLAVLLADRLHVHLRIVLPLLHAHAAPERFSDAADWLGAQPGWNSDRVAWGLRAFGVVAVG